MRKRVDSARIVHIFIWEKVENADGPKCETFANFVSTFSVLKKRKRVDSARTVHIFIPLFRRLSTFSHEKIDSVGSLLRMDLKSPERTAVAGTCRGEKEMVDFVLD